MRTPVKLVLAATTLLAALVSAGPAPAAAPTAEELVRRYDALMGPENFEAVAAMTAHRDDDSERTYKMRILKKGVERFRLWFQEPAAVKGQELLRQGENSWIYLPNMKRAMRLANRDSFQGGDFNNADVLRVNYQADYHATLVDAGDVPDAWCLELTAKSPDAAYDRIKLWLRKADTLPVKAEYYSASGKMLRSAEFSDDRDFGGIRRPAQITMRNMLATKRFSIMRWESLTTKVDPAVSRFVLDDLGH